MRHPLAAAVAMAFASVACSSIDTTGRTDGECPTTVPKTDDSCDVGAKVCTYCPGSAQCSCFDHGWRCQGLYCGDSGR